MKFLHNNTMSIRLKVLGTFAFTILLLVIGAVVTYFQLSGVEREMDVYADQSERAVIAANVASSIRGKYVAISDYYRNGEEENLTRYDDFTSQLTTELAALEGRMYTEESQELFKHLQAQILEFDERVERIPGDSGPLQNQRLQELTETRSAVVNNALNLSDVMLEEAGAAEKSVYDIISMNIVYFSIMVLIVIVSGGSIFWIVTSNLSKRLNQVVGTAEQLSRGNLAVEKIEIKSQDEAGRIGLAINQMIDNLSTMITNVRRTSDQVAASSEQLSASSTETTKVTEEITESIQEVASGADTQVEKAADNERTVNDMSKSIDLIASSIETVNESSEVSAQKAEHGTDVISSTMSQMTSIHELTDKIAGSVNGLAVSSEKIGSIISLITDVAEQTNLLALNAAIEAARAGEHGKGFAVVADEVRKLAEQTGNATNEISSLIAHIQQDIQHSVSYTKEGREAAQTGMSYMEDAGRSFEELSEAIHGVSSQMREVTAAVAQVEEGVNRVKSSVEETTSIAEQSAGYTQNVAASAEEQNASMEEISSSADQLAKMAEELQQSVSKFSL
ncbi:methyl-accepting chemotaxis protein [Salipaludibacillus agaradhaerens]|uniref:Methyl-accepting chemotaxis protein n=1 Tax=Salipaludibacillus agaradhaerens TaxID=76935 RepID=A0A9Q4AZP4_SALAG|nr:HAMP domain-containing methyl-accepting chemotaxis protein [Salipaludibacillus agaradhaerens]MCR6095396.1 methyl-accepting chemotaxis protein [Salipaludibacillus agaradhaerens]MCR6115046.1 methyl-accepting chemotaxis protein [Salipaludibacillus agaradhaerens]